MTDLLLQRLLLLKVLNENKIRSLKLNGAIKLITDVKHRELFYIIKII